MPHPVGTQCVRWFWAWQSK